MKKILSGIIGTAMLILPMAINAQTVTTTTTPNIPLCEITRTLRVGSSGEDVRCLQRYLNWAGFTIVTNGAGSPGNESIYFGSLTKSAVMRWQESNRAQVLTPLGLSVATGNFGGGSFAHYVTIVKTALGVQ